MRIDGVKKAEEALQESPPSQQRLLNNPSVE
jgi:hypothetical protein